MSYENKFAVANVKLDGGPSGTRRVYEQHEVDALLATLKSERDALMEAVEIYERLLSTPASGEPARKP